MTRTRQPLAALLVFFLPLVVVAYEGGGSTFEETPEPEPVPVLTKAPTLLEEVAADYPPELLESRPSGEVVLLIEIAPDGSVPSVEVVQSSDEPALDASAMAALRQYRFTPAEFDGVPGSVKVEYRYRFEPPPLPELPPQVNLRGVVLERGTREFLANAIVALPELELSTTTNERGEFELRGVPEGAVDVRIVAQGHRTFDATVDIVSGEETELKAYLWPTLGDGFESVVRGERVKKEVARRTLQREELTTVPGTFGDPLRVIQNLPGLSRPAFISGDILVRGSAPEDTAVLVDGIPIPLLYHFVGGPSVLNPSFIERIDFYPGAYGAKYGRAIGGVIDVGTRPAENKRLHGDFKIDLLDAGFYLEGPIKEGKDWGTWALSARRSYIDAFLPFVLDAVRQPGQASFATSPRYWDYQGRYDVTLGKNRLEFLAFGSNDYLNFAQAGTIEASGFTAGTEQGFHRFRIKWSRALESGWKLSVAPTMGLTDVSFGFNDQVTGDINSIDFNTRAAATKQISKSLAFETGLDLNANLYSLKFKLPNMPGYQTFPGENPDTELTTRTFGNNTASQGAYAEFVWDPIENVRLVPGVRLEMFQLPKGTEVSVDPRLSARWEFTPGWTAKGAWGRFHQGPVAMNLDSDFGNPYLGLSESTQSVLGIEGRLFPAITLDVQAFYNWRSELAIASNEIVDRDGKLRSEVYRNGGVGQAYGMEVLLKHELTKRFFGWVAYTLMRSEQRNEDTGTYLPVSTDQTHILTLVGSYKFEGGWEVGSRFRLTTGRPETPIAGSVFDADTGSFLRLNGLPGSARGTTFHQLDVRVEKTFVRETWKMSVYLDVQNIYNATNPEFLLYDYRYKQSAGFPGLPILPTLGVTGSF